MYIRIRSGGSQRKRSQQYHNQKWPHSFASAMPTSCRRPRATRRHVGHFYYRLYHPSGDTDRKSRANRCCCRSNFSLRPGTQHQVLAVPDVVRAIPGDSTMNYQSSHNQDGSLHVFTQWTGNIENPEGHSTLARDRPSAKQTTCTHAPTPD